MVGCLEGEELSEGSADEVGALLGSFEGSSDDDGISEGSALGSADG